MSLHERTYDRRPMPGRIVAWRSRRLREAGLSKELARTVAADCGYDLHAVLELIDRGCPPELALRIAAPLDRESLPC